MALFKLHATNFVNDLVTLGEGHTQDSFTIFINGQAYGQPFDTLVSLQSISKDDLDQYIEAMGAARRESTLDEKIESTFDAVMESSLGKKIFGHKHLLSSIETDANLLAVFDDGKQMVFTTDSLTYAQLVEALPLQPDSTTPAVPLQRAPFIKLNGANPQPAIQVSAPSADGVIHIPKTHPANSSPSRRANPTVYAPEPRRAEPTSTSYTSHGIEPAVRKVSAPLTIGILILPWIFAWFTLRKGHTTLARVVAMVWMTLTFLWVMSAGQTKPTDHTAATPANTITTNPTSITPATVESGPSGSYGPNLNGHSSQAYGPDIPALSAAQNADKASATSTKTPAVGTATPSKSAAKPSQHHTTHIAP